LQINRTFLALIAVWLITGAYIPFSSYVIIPLSIYFLNAKKLYLEILFGFFVILILSDNLYSEFLFATQIKNIYILILALIYLVNKRDFPIKLNILYYFLPFFFIASICIINSPIYFVSIQKTLSYALLIIIIPNYVFKLIKEDKQAFVNMFVSLGALVFIIGFISYFINYDFATRVGRYRGIFGNPNGLGIFTLLYFLNLRYIEQNFPELLDVKTKNIIKILLFVTLIMSGSRSAIFAILLFIVSYFFYKRSAFLGFISMLLFVFIYQFIAVNFISIVAAIGLKSFLRAETINEGSGRVVAWTFAWANIQKNYFFGQGIGYTDYLFKINYMKLSKLGHEGHAHNSYLTFWLDTGLAGLVSFILGLITYIIKFSKNNRIVFPILFAVLFSNQFESWLTASLNPFTIQFTFLIALFFAKSYIENETEEQSLTSNEDTIPVH